MASVAVLVEIAISLLPPAAVIGIGLAFGRPEISRNAFWLLTVRGADGEIHVIPNGEVRIVSSLTKEWSRAIVDVGVAYEENLERVLDVLGDAAASFALDPAFAPHLLEAPQVLGPMRLGDWAITVQVMVKTRPGRQWEVARELRKRILAACGREGIVLPYPRQETWTRSLNPAETPASVRAKQ